MQATLPRKCKLNGRRCYYGEWNIIEASLSNNEQ